MSLTSGSEIMPSGRTGTTRLRSLFFHTCTSSMSSGPMRNGSLSSSRGVSGAEADGLSDLPTGAGSASASPTTPSEATVVSSCGGSDGGAPAARSLRSAPHPAETARPTSRTNERTFIE